MNKVFDLYRYLKISGFNRESEILKTALETTPEELEEAFPSLFRFYEEGKPTAMFGGVFAQINKYIEEGYVTQQEIDAIQNFESLKQKMKELKTIKKETEAKFKYLNEYDIEQEFKDLAKEKKLSKEDFEFAYKSFIAEDEDNHQLDQAIVDIADLREKYRLLKEKINTIEDNEDLLSRLADPLSYKVLDSAYTEIGNLMMDVDNIIEGRQTGSLKKKLLNYYDYIYNGENKLNADYPKERASKAKETSKILYNDGNWAIINSWSEEACQYWERGAVRVEGDKVRFNTCTSRIAGVHGLTSKNMYNSYSGYTMFQILKLENGEPKFYEGPNEMLTLCFDFYNKDFQMIEGVSASVNADDNNMIEEMVIEALPENIYQELMKITKGEGKYFLLSFEQLLEADVPENLQMQLFEESVKKLEASKFFKLESKIPKTVFDSFLEVKLAELEPYDFFNRLANDQHYFNILDKKTLETLIKYNAEDLDTKYFIYFRRYYEDIFSEKIESKLSKVDKLEDFLGLGNNNVESELLEKYLYKNMDLFIKNFSVKTEGSLRSLGWYAGYFDTEKYLKDFSKAYVDKIEKDFLETKLGTYNWEFKFRLYDRLAFLDRDIRNAYLEPKKKENLKYISNYYLLRYLKRDDDETLYLGTNSNVRNAIISKIENNPKIIFETHYSNYEQSDKVLLNYVESKKYDALDSLTTEEYFTNLNKVRTFFDKDDEIFNNKEDSLFYSNENSKKLLTREERYIMRKMLDLAKETFKAHKLLRKENPEERLTVIIREIAGIDDSKIIKNILSIAKSLSYQEKVKVLNSLKEELFKISLEEENKGEYDYMRIFPLFIKVLYEELGNSKFSKESRSKELLTMLKKYS